jgi:bifunctional DNase/RNase
MDKFTEATVWNVAQTEPGMTLMLKLVDDEIVIPIFVDQMDAQTLFSVWRKDARAHRPRIYETFRELAVAMSLPLYRAEIYDIQDSLFRASILFTEQSRIERSLDPETSPVDACGSSDNTASGSALLVLETSPVDACVLALMFGCPICVSETVIQKIGVPVPTMLKSFKK